MAKRPGRAPTNPKRFDCKFELDTEEEGRLLRAAGGGPWIKSLVQAALGKLPKHPIAAEAEVKEDAIEVRVQIPLERLKQE